MQKITFLLTLFLLALTPLQAQVPTTPIGLNPPSIDWQEIKTDRVQVIFPKEIEPLAQRLASMVHYMWDNNNQTIGDKLIPVSIMLHNQPVISNGFVTVGPFRSEFYASPPQYNQLTDWIDILSVHEYRHVMQFGNSRQGLTQIAQKTLGSWAWGGFAGAALPRWFFEGDAVATETALTGSGRGRLPSFGMEYRALLEEDIEYNYEKASAGSLTDYVPNWYTLGYYMTTRVRQQFGADIWKGVVTDAVRYKGLFFPFSKSLDRRTGLTTPELYNETFANLDSIWPADDRDSLTVGETIRHESPDALVNYNHPIQLPDGRILVEKRGYDLIPTYFAISPNGSEEKITASGAIFSPLNTSLSYSQNRIVWSELAFDPRWGNRNYSVIRSYDMASGKKQRLTTETRLYSPVFDRQAKRIAAVELGLDMYMDLVILDAESGRIVERLPNPENDFLAFPQWLPDENAIVAIAQKEEKARLVIIDLSTGAWRDLTPPAEHHLSHPFVRGDYVYFSAAVGGTNNIYAVRLEDQLVFQLTDVYTGAFQPSISREGGELLFSLFTYRGFEIQRLKFEEALWKPTTLAVPNKDAIASMLSEQEGGSIVGIVPEGDYPVHTFKRNEHIINPHSILPYGSPPVYGLELLSDNVFGTLSATVGGFYNVNDRDFSFIAGARYAALFPVFRADYRMTHRSSFLLNFEELNDTTLVQTAYNQRWVEHNPMVGVSVPLNFSAGNAVTRLNVQAVAGYLGVRPKEDFDNPNLQRDTFVVENTADLESIIRPPMTKEGLGSADLRADFISYRRTAVQHIKPRWGIGVNTRFRSTFAGKSLKGQQWILGADFYMPGLRTNHSFYLNTEYKKEDLLNNYKYSDVFFYPRGYRTQLSDSYLKIGFNYSLPLIYPDWALGPVAFVKRVKVNVFYDWGRAYLQYPFDSHNDINSVGFELTADFRLFRLLEIDAGIRYSYAFDQDATRNGSHNQFDFLLLSVRE